MKCADCLEDITTQKVSRRADLCDRCWNLRGQLLTALKQGKISREQFAYAQEGPTRLQRMTEVLQDVPAGR